MKGKTIVSDTIAVIYCPNTELHVNFVTDSAQDKEFKVTSYIIMIVNVNMPWYVHKYHQACTHGSCPIVHMLT